MNKLALFLLTTFINVNMLLADTLQKEPAKEATPSPVKMEENLAELHITNVRARSNNSSRNSALYFTIENVSDRDIVITGGDTPLIANRVELHDIVTDKNGKIEMKKLDKLLLPAKSSLEFKPRSLHIMLMELKKNLIVGENFVFNLHTDMGSKELSVEVKQDVNN